MGGILIVLISACVITVVHSVHEIKNSSWMTNERKLYNDLMTDYNKYVRPVQHENDAITVSFAQTMVQIEDLDEATQTLVFHAWLKFSWKDAQITWTPSEYGEVKEIRLPVDKLWTPDIILYNGADPHMMEPAYTYLAIAYPDGTIIWIPSIIVTSRCNLDLYYFPYDEQVCSMKWGSWTYTMKQVNLTWMGEPGKIDLSLYMEHNEWEIVEHSGERNEKHYACCPDDIYPDINYNVKLKRRSGYHTHLFAAPSVALMFLMPTMFILPAESGEKITLGVGILICQTLLLGALQQYMPSAHPTVPLLGVYYLTNIVLTGLSLFFSSIVINAWHKSTHNVMVPTFVRTLVLGVLSRLMCVKRETYVPLENPEQSMRRLEVMSDSDQPSMMEDDKQRMMQSYARLTTISEWRQLSVVLDRLFFVIFLVVAVLVFLIMGTK